MNPKTIVFLVIAVVLLIIALVVGAACEPWKVHLASSGSSISPNILAALTAFGFAIAGGLSVVAAAIVESRSA